MFILTQCLLAIIGLTIEIDSLILFSNFYVNTIIIIIIIVIIQHMAVDKSLGNTDKIFISAIVPPAIVP